MDSHLLMQNEANSGWSRTGHRRAGHAGSWNGDQAVANRHDMGHPENSVEQVSTPNRRTKLPCLASQGRFIPGSE